MRCLAVLFLCTLALAGWDCPVAVNVAIIANNGSKRAQHG